jgi:hypothetical protein
MAITLCLNDNVNRALPRIQLISFIRLLVWVVGAVVSIRVSLEGGRVLFVWIKTHFFRSLNSYYGRSSGTNDHLGLCSGHTERTIV